MTERHMSTVHHAAHARLTSRIIRTVELCSIFHDQVGC